MHELLDLSARNRVDEFAAQQWDNVTGNAASIDRDRRRLLLVASFCQVYFAQRGDRLGSSEFGFHRGFVLAKFRFRKDPCRRDTRLFDRQLAEGSDRNFSKRGVSPPVR